MKAVVYSLINLAVVLSLPGCTTISTNQYDATALTRYTWQVEYSTDPTKTRSRYEAFATSELLNRNGEKPAGAVTGPDDRGLWWGALPPRPTVDDIEQRQQLDKPDTPQLIKSVTFQISFLQNGQPTTLPTNYDVYRTVVKAKRSNAPLELTLGVGDRSVEKAEPK
ncbi:hypothetical protein H6F43_06650 [Leptolyngbya sp. FACHB-36]|uniref:hypothetical protein n=1 Tax=Leptolyngbya sp. FACHB-36 TaxID=2692808 RepID=UPI001681B2D7|nr:hypothetical protein [Leptolyngbya sp. FACHB-36]MBD2019867.1 hypothetical protein [Leptolyngbya sp. FACHB-36]